MFGQFWEETITLVEQWLENSAKWRSNLWEILKILCVSVLVNVKRPRSKFISWNISSCIAFQLTANCLHILNKLQIRCSAWTQVSYQGLPKIPKEDGLCQQASSIYLLTSEAIMSSGYMQQVHVNIWTEETVCQHTCCFPVTQHTTSLLQGTDFRLLNIWSNFTLCYSWILEIIISSNRQGSLLFYIDTQEPLVMPWKRFSKSITRKLLHFMRIRRVVLTTISTVLKAENHHTSILHILRVQCLVSLHASWRWILKLISITNLQNSFSFSETTNGTLLYAMSSTLFYAESNFLVNSLFHTSIPKCLGILSLP